MKNQLKNRTALVTGGTGGVGKEIARALAQLGAQLIIVGRDADKGARANRRSVLPPIIRTLNLSGPTSV